MVRKVLTYPDSALKLPSARVERIDDEVRRVAEDLLDTMGAHNRCVGIAAPQIGVHLRIVVVDVSGHPKARESSGRMVLVNPTISQFEGSEMGREGCLSLPEITANVRRSVRVNLKAVRLDEGPFVISTSGFEARALQHEIDHLDGILILDRAASPAEIFPRKRDPRTVR